MQNNGLILPLRKNLLGSTCKANNHYIKENQIKNTNIYSKCVIFFF